MNTEKNIIFEKIMNKKEILYYDFIYILKTLGPKDLGKLSKNEDKKEIIKNIYNFFEKIIISLNTCGVVDNLIYLYNFIIYKKEIIDDDDPEKLKLALRDITLDLIISKKVVEIINDHKHKLNKYFKIITFDSSFKKDIEKIIKQKCPGYNFDKIYEKCKKYL